MISRPKVLYGQKTRGVQPLRAIDRIYKIDKMGFRKIATCGSAVGNPVNHVNLVDEFCTYGSSGKPVPSGRQARAIDRIYKIVKMGFRKIATCGSAVGNPVNHVNLVDEFSAYGG